MAYYLIIRGPMGSGKTTVAAALARDLGLKHVAVDRVLDDYHLTDKMEDGYISQKSFQRANEIIALEAAPLLFAGTSVVFDGNFYWQSQIEDLIRRLQFPHAVFTLEVPLDMCIARDEQREKTHGKDAVEAVYAKSTSFSDGAPVDGSGSLADTQSRIMAQLPQ